MTSINQLEPLMLEFIEREMQTDAAHDLNHVKRVVATAKQLCDEEQANPQVVVAAAYLHDCFTYPKDHPERKQSSAIAADKAVAFLAQIDYPPSLLAAVHHAICAHSFSAGIPPDTLEAKIVQDADRLDSLGAIGVARTIQVGTALQRPLYNADDPLCHTRPPNDNRFTLDHFFIKLFAIADTMNTEAAKAEARKRKAFMQLFLDQLQHEANAHD